ncbi:hypothetical protein AB670_01472 [Chryseobacterium sp. MOF25P]|uniref:hypothetical protein n=1 Tax=unclassified Chryseobacterium TaxID=2593645 RepID=UPI000805B51E|nr:MULTISPECIES: hypothetical protein [unclassified Chryseobacterium]OBW42175.1 hypothetical protein AB670_01472 [Chryseobacterium sp. MOF25P]OBW46920.1 hypothetical protein AB671_01016 [Chryseobacterium sp. BGARF1]
MTLFRQDWTKKEILDNLALAYTTKVCAQSTSPTNPGNQYIGVISDGRTAVICIIDGQNGIYQDYINILKTSWPVI